MRLLSRYLRLGRLAEVNQRVYQRQRAAPAYRSASYVPLRPWQVRNRRFNLVRFGRAGVDEAEVTAYLERVADDLAALYAELAEVREQNYRIKDALRRWQSQQTPTAYDLAGRR
jgi:DivIVA domain-containing protein